MENLILIGMPGCGKSTVGKLLAKKLGKTFMDADAELVETFGKSIPDIQESCYNHLITFAAEEARKTQTVVDFEEYVKSL